MCVGGGYVTRSEKKGRSGRRAPQSMPVGMRGRRSHSIYMHICVWRHGGWRGGGSKEMAGEGHDEEMGDGRGGGGWWRGRGEDKWKVSKWFGDKGNDDFVIFSHFFPAHSKHLKYVQLSSSHHFTIRCDVCGISVILNPTFISVSRDDFGQEAVIKTCTQMIRYCQGNGRLKRYLN